MSEELPQKTPSKLLWAVGVFVTTFCAHTFAFPPFNVPELAYLLPLPAVLWLLYQSPSRKQFLWSAGGGFWLSWVVLIVWLRHVTWFGWIGLATILSLFPLVWVWVTYWMLPKFKDREALIRFLGILSVCSVWTLLEFVRTFFLSGFPWLPLAATQWQRPLMLQVASWTGFYGASFLLIMVGMVIAFYLRHLFRGRQKGLARFCPEFLIGVTIWMFATFGLFQIKFEHDKRETFFKAALIQPYIPQTIKWDHSKSGEIMSEIKRQVVFQKAIGADIAIFPEAVLPYPIIGDDGMRKWAEELTRDFGAPVLLGALAAEGATQSDDPWYNGLMIIYPDKGVDQNYYQKRKRVPFGEFIPFRKLLFFIEKFVPIGSDISRGTSAGPLRLDLKDGNIPFGTLICYEDIFPGLAVDSVKAGARVLVVVTNDAWYGEEGAAYQHAAHSVLRAVETNRPVVRVGNGGWSGWIDEYGNIQDVLESEEGSVYFRGGGVVEVTYDPQTYRKLTFFVRYGNWFIAVCGGLLILFLILVRRVPGAMSEEEEWQEVEKMKFTVPK
jgi:apolipoprotein N-acyltransferase